LAHLVRQWRLRPIAVHLDNHWNSEIAEENISNIIKTLEFDEKRVTINWEEFKDLQLAFLKASTPDSEIPTDNVIDALMWDTAKEYNIKYILSGSNSASESILPRAWSQGHNNKAYILTIHKKFGKQKKLSFHVLDYYETRFYTRFNRKKIISALDYVKYDKEIAKSIIIKELGWKDYGRKHGESIYTRIVQEYILPVKFGFDKRKAHYSSLIVADQMTRDEAIKKLSEPLYANEKSLQNDINMLCSKFEISKDEFKQIMALPLKCINDYIFDDKPLRLFYFVLFLMSCLLKRK
jgi:hypothetical protein